MLLKFHNKGPNQGSVFNLLDGSYIKIQESLPATIYQQTPVCKETQSNYCLTGESESYDYDEPERMCPPDE